MDVDVVVGCGGKAKLWYIISKVQGGPSFLRALALKQPSNRDATCAGGKT